MKRYLVGGAVRDALLGRKTQERDWVVVGATEAQMLAAGYLQPTANMPVFLDAELREEHALARLEQKSGPGHRGFLFMSSPDVTLEQDLRRRDLTINAIAQDAGGALIDPCGGQADLAGRLLRHISAAFAEDPLRVLRVARFAAELAGYDFRVAPDTLRLMGQIVDSGELATLPAERIWREADRALRSDHPQRFFRCLHQCGALKGLFPGLDGHLSQITKRLQQAVGGRCEPPWRWAAVTAQMGQAELERLHRALKPPGRFVRAGRLAAQLLPEFAAHRERSPAHCLRVLERADAFRRPEDFRQLLRLARCVQPGLPAEQWSRALDSAAAVKLADTVPLKGAAYGAALRQARLAALAEQG